MPAFRRSLVPTAGATVLATLLLTASASAATVDLYTGAAGAPTGDRTVGSTITYTVDVFNQGPDAGEATWTDGLGAAEQFVSAVSTVGTCTQAAPVVCSLGTLAPGTGATITVRVKLTKAGDNQNAWRVTGSATDTDGNPNDNLGGAGFQVAEPAAPEVATPTVDSGSASEVGQTHIEVEARLAPYGKGKWWVEYGTTRAYGKRTVAKSVGGDREVTRTASFGGLKRGTRYHFRAVLLVDGKTYRGRNVTEKTFGKVLYPEITLKAERRTATSTRYIGRVGPASLVDTATACAGTVTVEVYTLQGADLLRRTTKVTKDCTYALTVPFGAQQRARYGRKGSVLVQARFSGNRFVAGAGSTADKP